MEPNLNELPWINYQMVIADLGVPGSEQDWEQLRSVLVREWRGLYSDSLGALGLDDDGEFMEYPDGGFRFCTDFTPSQGDGNWKAVHRNWRVIVIHGFSRQMPEERDQSRLASWRKNYLAYEFTEDPKELKWDVGHYIAHSVGGFMENNLFAQRSDVNRAHSEQGRTWRAMERFAANHPGTFVFVRPIYGDVPCHPFFVEYGLYTVERGWWVEVFPNRYLYKPYTGPDCLPVWRVRQRARQLKYWTRQNRST